MTSRRTKHCIGTLGRIHFINYCIYNRNVGLFTYWVSSSNSRILTSIKHCLGLTICTVTDSGPTNEHLTLPRPNYLHSHWFRTIVIWLIQNITMPQTQLDAKLCYLVGATNGPRLHWYGVDTMFCVINMVFWTYCYTTTSFIYSLIANKVVTL